MNEIFINYNRLDEAFARQLTDALTKMGVDVWLDQDRIKPFEYWGDAVQRGLETCDVMLVVITPEAMASPDVTAAWQEYRTRKRPIVSVLLRPSNNIPSQIAPSVDFQQRSFDSALLRLYVELREVGIELQAPSEPLVPTPEQPLTPVEIRRRDMVRWLLVVLLLISNLFLTFRWVNRNDDRRTAVPYLIRTYGANQAGETDAAFSPDGKYLLVGDMQGIFTLWEVDTGRLLRSIEIPSILQINVAFSPHGDFILIGVDIDGTVYRVDMANNAEPQRLFASDSYMLDFAISPDGQSVAICGADGTVELWDVPTGERLRGFSGHTSYVNAVAFSPDGNYLVSGGDDGKIMLWDVISGNQVRAFVGHGDDVNDVAFSPDGLYLLTGSDDGTAMLWIVSMGSYLDVLDNQFMSVSAVAFSPDGQMALTGSFDRTAKLWNLASGQVIRTFDTWRYSDDLHRDIITYTGSIVSSVAFSPDGHYVLTSHINGEANLWESGLK